jgi:hypothetical protein
MLADTNDYQMTNDNVQQTVFGWAASDPAPTPVTNPPGSTCCFESKGRSAGQACCWSVTNQNPYDKFLVRLANAAEATQTVEMVDLAASGLNDGVLSGWGCANKPGAGEMHRPVQVEIELLGACTGSSSDLNKVSCAAWKDFAKATDITGWKACSGARLDPCACKFVGGVGGVTCADGNITELRLFENNLKGTIPSSLASLTELTMLGLDGNNLKGTIPSSLASLTKLGYLILDDNALTGLVPPPAVQTVRR